MFDILLLSLMISTSSGCGGASWVGNCSVSNSGSSVDIGGSLGGSDGGDRTGGSDRGSGGEDDADGDGDQTRPRTSADCPMRRCGYTVELIRQPAMSDLASFAPAPTAIAGEPAGYGVVGMPVNFVVPAEAHRATGTLFDLPVTVTFTPESVVVFPGDGTSRSARTGGSTWAALGQAQFSATPTSHAYAMRGVYTAHAVVHYSAVVDFGNGPIPVPGLLEVPTAGTSIEVLEVRTALVERTCRENPSGPGC